MVNIIPKVGKYYLIRSSIRYIDRNIVAKCLDENGQVWESIHHPLYNHTCNGKGRMGYCMWDTPRKIIREVKGNELIAWLI